MGQRNYRSAFAGAAFCLTLGIASGFAQSPDAPIGLLLEPAFAAPDIYHEVEGAKATVLVPARNTSVGLDTFTEAEWEREGLGWPEVMPSAMKLADELARVVSIEWARDHRGVILYGEIQSGNPFVGSVIFSDQILSRLRASLGAEVLAVVPERDRLFLFPKHGGKLQDFAPALIQRYKESPFKVSLEIFQIDHRGCRVVGALEP